MRRLQAGHWAQPERACRRCAASSCTCGGAWWGSPGYPSPCHDSQLRSRCHTSAPTGAAIGTTARRRTLRTRTRRMERRAPTRRVAVARRAVAAEAGVAVIAMSPASMVPASMNVAKNAASRCLRISRLLEGRKPGGLQVWWGCGQTVLGTHSSREASSWSCEAIRDVVVRTRCRRRNPDVLVRWRVPPARGVRPAELRGRPHGLGRSAHDPS
jgi:hypothetical protein